MSPGSLSKRIRVVFVLPSLNAGGAERVLITLMNRLDRARFEPHFITLNDQGSLRDWIYTDIHFISLGQYKKVIHALPSLLLKLWRIKPDVVFSTMAHVNFGVLLLRPFLPLRTRIIVREAIVPSFICETIRKGWLARFCYRTLYPLADLVISPAQTIIDEFRDYLGMKATNHALLYNPVDAERILSPSDTLPQDFENRENTVHFVCAGRLHYQKGFDRLIEALPALEHPMNWRLSILGTGEQQPRLQDLIEKNNLTDKVFLTGFTKRPWPIVATADCFLLPSRWEGMPNVVLESLSIGTPVIASAQAGGVQEIAGHAQPGAVTLAPTMDDFIKAMRAVRPDPSRASKPSMLPKRFGLETVIARLSSMLEGKETFSLPSEEKRQAT